MLNQHYLGIHACVMRLEIAVQVGGAKTICVPFLPSNPGNQIKRRRVELSQSQSQSRVDSSLDSCGPIKVYYACSKLQLVATGLHLIWGTDIVSGFMHFP